MDVDGTMSAQERQRHINEFNKDDAHNCFDPKTKGYTKTGRGLLFSKVVSEGVNLHRGSVLFILVSSRGLFYHPRF